MLKYSDLLNALDDDIQDIDMQYQAQPQGQMPPYTSPTMPFSEPSHDVDMEDSAPRPVIPFNFSTPEAMTKFYEGLLATVEANCERRLQAQQRDYEKKLQDQADEYQCGLDMQQACYEYQQSHHSAELQSQAQYYENELASARLYINQREVEFQRQQDYLVQQHALLTRQLESLQAEKEAAQPYFQYLTESLHNLRAELQSMEQQKGVVEEERDHVQELYRKSEPLGVEALNREVREKDSENARLRRDLNQQREIIHAYERHLTAMQPAPPPAMPSRRNALRRSRELHAPVAKPGCNLM